MVYAHEFGHIALGLPDLYSYQIAYKGPADWREAAVYVGPWDLMSRSNERPQIGAWGKVHVGWISPNRVLEILPGQEGRANLEPLEKSTSGTQAILIYLNSSTYFIVENREPIGHDSVLPDEGVLVSYVDESKYWHGNGPVVIQDANPENLSRWQLSHPTFKIGPGAKSEYVNQTYNLIVSLLGKTSDNSYIVDVSTQGRTKTQTQPFATQYQVQLLLVVMAVVVVAASITIANRKRKKRQGYGCASLVREGTRKLR